MQGEAGTFQENVEMKYGDKSKKQANFTHTERPALKTALISQLPHLVLQVRSAIGGNRKNLNVFYLTIFKQSL